MSCEDCEKMQETMTDDGTNWNIDSFFKVYFLRVANGNVAVVCCEKHFSMLRDAWRKYLKEQD